MLVSGMVATDTTAVAPAYAGQTSTTPSTLVSPSTEAALKKADATVTSSEVKQATKQPSNDPNANVESQVREYFADIPLMAEISKCESQFRQFEKDGSIFRGRITDRDVGVMQVNEYFHKDRASKLGYDLHTLEGNMGYARYLYEEQGAQPWVSSSPCWKKSAVAKAMVGTKEVAVSKSKAMIAAASASAQGATTTLALATPTPDSISAEISRYLAENK